MLKSLKRKGNNDGLVMLARGCYCFTPSHPPYKQITNKGEFTPPHATELLH